MPSVPSDWFSLLLLTFVLGMKHGFDADHLATIDGLTRHNARLRPAMARYCGSLFSLGHGAVVLAIALGASAAAGACPPATKRSIEMRSPATPAAARPASTTSMKGPGPQM